MSVKEVPLTQGYCALVDDTDYCRIMANGPWQIKRDKHYAVYAKRGQNCQAMHRFILGVVDPKMMVDHIDHNGLNNQRSNLRLCTSRKNQQNSRKLAHATSIYKGVATHHNKWKARITVDGKGLHLGLFATELEAARAYDLAAVLNFGEHANPNVPEEWRD